MTTMGGTGRQLDPRVGRSLTVVHVSDLHFGPSHRFGGQTTASGDRVADGPSLLDSLKADLASVLSREAPETSAPILIAVTGDLTDAAEPEQFEEAATFILGLEQFLENRTARTVIVPGNHDVLWEKATTNSRLSTWRAFSQDLNRNTVGQSKHPFSLVYDEYADSHGAIIAAINSAGFVEKSKPDEKRGRISAEGITDLDIQLRSLPTDDNLIRIALVHHHPILIPDLVEERRGYDAIVDGGDLMRVLRRHRFHMILHGHKHLPFNFSEDSRAAYSTRQPREQRPILVVCGGSVGSKEISDRMKTPTNYYNILRIKWLPRSGECRSRIEPRQLERFEDSGTQLARGEWHWEPCLADDRCYEPPPAEADEMSQRGETISFAEGGIKDGSRTRAYRINRGAFPVVEIRPSLIPSQAHQAYVWIEYHPHDDSKPNDQLMSVIWSAGKKHDVIRISGDSSGRFAAVFSYYGPMLVMAMLTFASGHQSTQYIYVPMRHISEQEV